MQQINFIVWFKFLHACSCINEFSSGKEMNARLTQHIPVFTTMLDGAVSTFKLRVWHAELRILPSILDVVITIIT